METERRSQRYPSDRPLQLRCETWAEFVDAYASDVCRGGMFIRTHDAPEVMSSVEIRLHLPDDSSVTWSARVVHAVPPEQAAAQQRAAGVGVEFTQLDAEQKRQIQQLVEFARNQRDNADPNASFARSLLENTPPMAASEVGARLSMRASSGAVDAQPAARSVQSSQSLPVVRLGAEQPAAVSGEAHDASSQRRVLRPASASLQRMLAVRPSSAANEAVRDPRATRPRDPTGPLDPNTSARAPTGPVRTAAARAPTGPLAAAPARAHTGPVGTAPARPATGPLGAAPARAPTGPVRTAGARPATGPLAAAPARAHTGPVGTAPARPATGPLAAAPARAHTGSDGAAPARSATGPLDAAPARPQTGPLDAQPPAADGAAADAPPMPARPTDMQRLALVLNALAHKHYEDAARIAREMLAENPGDPQVLKWQAICFARLQLARGDQDSAAEQYSRALEFDAGNREARDFVRDYARDRKLSALPFGRYFTKKK